MGKRGPQPLPEALLELRGSNVPQTRERKREALRPVPGGSPNRPAFLNAAAAAVWDEIAPILLDMGVLSRADGQALGRYCKLVLEWRELSELVDGQPRVVKPSKNSRAFLNPLLKYRIDLARELQSLEDRFGLTPSARMSLNVTAMFQPGHQRPQDIPNVSPAPAPTPSTSTAAGATPPPESNPPIGGERFFRSG